MRASGAKLLGRRASQNPLKPGDVVPFSELRPTALKTPMDSKPRLRCNAMLLSLGIVMPAYALQKPLLTRSSSSRSYSVRPTP